MRREIVAGASFRRPLPSSATQSARTWASTSSRASSALVEPEGECGQVGAVRALARLREPAVLEKAVDRRGGAHGLRIRASAVELTSDRQA